MFPNHDSRTVSIAEQCILPLRLVANESFSVNQTTHSLANKRQAMSREYSSSGIMNGTTFNSNTSGFRYLHAGTHILYFVVFSKGAGYRHG